MAHLFWKFGISIALLLWRSREMLTSFKTFVSKNTTTLRHNNNVVPFQTVEAAARDVL